MPLGLMLTITGRLFFGGEAAFLRGVSYTADAMETPDQCRWHRRLLRMDSLSYVARVSFVLRCGRLLQSLGSMEPWSWDELTDKPMVVLLVGTNGSGKTTSCAKLGFCAAKHRRKALLAGADTFRAAGTDQLRIWADRLGCDIVAGRQGADAAAVAFDAAEAAVTRGFDYLFIDTAGRMHTKLPLMSELQKVKRSLAKVKNNAPQEVWIVLDAALGQNAIAQARLFHESTPLTGANRFHVMVHQKAALFFLYIGNWECLCD
jgi:hypothetical protein